MSESTSKEVGVPPESSRRHTVLILDDQPMIRRVINRELSRHFEVVATGTFDEAVAVLDSGIELDAVVSDRFLGPGKSGLDFLELVKQRRPGLARVMASGTVFDSLVRRALSSGTIDRYLAKPWGVGQLRSTLIDLLGTTHVT